MSEITSAVLNGFKTHSVVLLLGDCGTGKTYTTFKMIEHDIANGNLWILLTLDAINVKSYLPEQNPLTLNLDDLKFDLGIPEPQVFITEISSESTISSFVISEFAHWIISKAKGVNKFTLYIDDMPNDLIIELLNTLFKFGHLDELNIKLLLTDYGDLFNFLIESKEWPTTILLGSN